MVFHSTILPSLLTIMLCSLGLLIFLIFYYIIILLSQPVKRVNASSFHSSIENPISNTGGNPKKTLWEKVCDFFKNRFKNKSPSNSSSVSSHFNGFPK